MNLRLLNYNKILIMFFNAELKEEEVLQILQNGQSHSCGGVILTKKDNKITEKPIKHYSEYISTANVSTIERIVTSKLPSFNIDISGYNVEIKTSGSFRISVEENKLSFGTLSDHKSSQYFDTVVYDSDIKCLTYSNKNVSGLIHSGDKIINHTLFHSVTINSTDKRNFIIGACGYNKRPLNKFVDNSPVIMSFDHDAKIIYIIPCPIDRASIGDATLACYASFTIYKDNHKNYIDINIIEPLVVNNVNTGNCSDIVRQVIQKALVLQPIILEEIINPYPVNNCIPSTNEILDKNIIQFSDCGFFCELSDSINIHTHHGFGNEEPNTSDYPKSPFQYGICEGHGSVLLGINSNISISFEQINNSHIVHHTSIKGWNHFTANTNTCVGNGIFIIHLTSTEIANIDNLSIYQLSMMGPRSLVVYEHNGHYYNYRGQADCFDILDFKSEISDFILRLNDWCKLPLKFPTISRKDDTIVYGNIDGMFRDITMDEFLDLSIEEVACNLSKQEENCVLKNMLYLMTQFQIVCPVDKLDTICAKIITILKFGLSSEKKKLCKNMNACLQNGDIKQLKIFGIEYRKCESLFNDKYQEILLKLNSMVSQKGVISRQHSLQRIERKVAIKSNVEAVKHLSINDIITKSFDNNGCVILNIKFTKLQRILHRLQDFSERNDNFIDSNEFVSQNILYFDCFEPSQRCLNLDNETLQTVVEITSDKIHELTGNGKCIALPGMASECNTCFAIPLSEEFMNKNPPDFKNLANNPKFAHFRITLRETIVQANSSRTFNLDPSSTLLGATISMIILQALEKFTKDMTSPAEENSNVQKIIRGLLGFVLTTMASGVNGQINAYELFDNATSVPKSIESWKIYQRIMLQARFAGWINHKILAKYKKVTSRFISVFNEINNKKNDYYNDFLLG